jgi:predicted phosphodiesterase
MQIAVISDLHLGTGGSTDEFGHDDAEFLKFLDFLEGNFEKVVLLGDIWETLTAPSPARQLEQLRAAQQRHLEISQRFSLGRYQYIHGNHDLVAGRHLGVPAEHTVYADGVRLLFSHGHQGDGLCSTARPLSEMAVWLGAWIRRLGLDWAYRQFVRIEQIRTGNSGECRVRRWALDQAERRQVDVVITGHTHVPVCDESGSTLFLNSGTCAQGEISFLSLDTKRGDYRVNVGY